MPWCASTVRACPLPRRSWTPARTASRVSARTSASGRTSAPAASRRGRDSSEGGFERSSEDMVWFRMSVGRRNNADPRWLLPIICRLGHVTKKEIGSIKIFDRETKFEIVKSHARNSPPPRARPTTRTSASSRRKPARQTARCQAMGGPKEAAPRARPEERRPKERGARSRRKGPKDGGDGPNIRDAPKGRDKRP